jgi:3-oxoacyl-[acyl-carrier protein] reductase
LNGEQAARGRPVAVVTGAGAGIGAAVAVALAASGHHVVVADRNRSAGESVAAGIGETAEYLAVDAAATTSVDALFDAVAERHGGLRVLVNNAGVPMRRGPLAELDDAEWDRQLAVNAGSVFRCCRAAIPLLQDGGCIVNVASLSAVRARPGFSAYAAAKAAVIMLTRVLALELAPRIRVNAVSPVATDTALLAGLNPAGQSLAAYKEEMRAGIPLQRLNAPDDVAAAVTYLASDGAAMVTGHNLIVDGGAA